MSQDSNNPKPSNKSKPTKTWDHLAARRQRPNEYAIVSTNLHWRTVNPKAPFELNPEIPMSRWYLKYCNASPLKHDDWNGFRDPDQLVYRTYNVLQDERESYVDGLLDEHERIGHDKTLSQEWVKTLARLYSPGRYLLHCVQMGSAYLVHMAPASTITICAAFQMADSLRWVSRIAYRTRELADHHPGNGFGSERSLWENDPAWQGFRELMERALVAYDWAEAFVALNVVAKPAIDEAFLRQFGHAARQGGDALLAMLADAQLMDSERSRRWTAELVSFAIQKEGNKAVLENWTKKWLPLADKAIAEFCAHLPNSGEASAAAKAGVREFGKQLGLVA
jgi:toluene monooxygenase system protein E